MHEGLDVTAFGAGLSEQLRKTSANRFEMIGWRSKQLARMDAAIWCDGHQVRERAADIDADGQGRPRAHGAHP